MVEGSDEKKKIGIARLLTKAYAEVKMTCPSQPFFGCGRVSAK